MTEIGFNLPTLGAICSALFIIGTLLRFAIFVAGAIKTIRSEDE